MEGKVFCDALDRALDLEVEGYEFYMRCAAHTSSGEGQDFFRYLAGEELIHHDKVAEIYRDNFNSEYCDYRDRINRMKKVSGVFEEHVPGGDLDVKSDALDALNIALKAEENSIRLYRDLAGRSDDPEMGRFFEKLAGEEENHRSLLETEIDFITETGAFKDFRAVTF
jgi:rubrerythrin